MGWDYVSKLLPLIDILSSPRWYEFGERPWNIILTVETEDLGEKPVPVPLYPPQIPNGLTRARIRACEVRGRGLTAWAMAQPSYSPTHKLTTIYNIQSQIKMCQWGKHGCLAWESKTNF
jgi:hypothetical protein